MRIRMLGNQTSRLPLLGRRILSRTTHLALRIPRRISLGRCDCGVLLVSSPRSGRARGFHHSTRCAVYSPVQYFTRTQCWLLGHAPLRIVDRAHQERIVVQRGGGFLAGGVEHETVHTVIDASHFTCRCCLTILDRNLDLAPLGARAALGREGGALGHLWIGARRAAGWRFGHVSGRKL